MSRAGAAEAGFTLIELLAVMTLVALLAAVAMPRLGSLLSPSIERTTRRVALAVREQRTVAMLTGRLVTLNAAAVAPLLPRGTEVEQTWPEEAGILFMPDGSSSGGRLVLEARDGRRAIDIDWLTGRITVGAAP
jgi:general secretion pathway protein H